MPKFKGEWAIMDNKGIIHTGTEEQMRTAWDCMTMECYDVEVKYECTTSDAQGMQMVWEYKWTGDLRLIQIHEIHN